MRTTSQQVDPLVERESIKNLFEILGGLKNSQEIEAFFRAILSETEITAVARKLAIVFALLDGHSYPQIKERLKVSSSTIAAAREMVEKPGIQLAVKNRTAEQWAIKWEGRIRKLFR